MIKSKADSLKRLDLKYNENNFVKKKNNILDISFAGNILLSIYKNGNGINTIFTTYMKITNNINK